jgi:hypothetical protein
MRCRRALVTKSQGNAINRLARLQQMHGRRVADGVRGVCRSRRLGIFGVAAASASARRCATLFLVIVCPPRLGSSAEAGSRSGLNLKHD